jgi:hypothetical protein
LDCGDREVSEDAEKGQLDHDPGAHGEFFENTDEVGFLDK